MMNTTRIFAAAAARLPAVGLVLALVLGLAIGLTAGPASAHTTLQDASPGIGSTVAPPSEIVLTYADPVRFTQVIVTDSNGQQRQSGHSYAVDNKVTEKIAGPLPNGVYTVAWRVVAPDGHPVEGTYQFTVAGSTAAAAPKAGARAGTSSTSSTNGWWWIGLVILLGAGAGAGIVLLRRSLKADTKEAE